MISIPNPIWIPFGYLTWLWEMDENGAQKQIVYDDLSSMKHCDFHSYVRKFEKGELRSIKYFGQESVGW